MYSFYNREKSTHHVLQLPEGKHITLNGKGTSHTDLAELIVYLGQKRKALMWPVPLLHPVNV